MQTELPKAREATINLLLFRAIGIVGVVVTGFTIFTNLKGILEFSNLVRRLTDNWQESITRIVNHLLSYIDIQMDVSDAVILFAILSCLIVAFSSQGSIRNTWTLSFRVLGLIVASIFSASYFTFIIASGRTADVRMEDDAINYFLISGSLSLLFSIPLFSRSSPSRNKVFTIIGSIGFVCTLSLYYIIYIVHENAGSGVLFEFYVYGIFAFTSLIVIFMYYVSNTVEVTIRSFSIGGLVLICIGFNYLSRLAENAGLIL